MTIHIDPEEGTEAAAEMPDDQFQVLLRIVMWELAMRTSPESFERHLRDMADVRARIEGDIVACRRVRDQRVFVASVLGDIERLPTTASATNDLTTGLYL